MVAKRTERPRGLEDERLIAYREHRLSQAERAEIESLLAEHPEHLKRLLELAGSPLRTSDDD